MEKILQVIRDSQKKFDIVVEKYNFAVQKNTNLLEEINFLKSEIATLNDQNVKVENQRELLLKEYQESEDKSNIGLKMLKDYEERIQELEINNLDLKNELRLKNDELEITQEKYNIKTNNLNNIIEEKDEIIKEKEQIIKEKKLNEKKSYIKSFDSTNELLKSDIKLKIDKTIEKINSLIS